MVDQWESEARNAQIRVLSEIMRSGTDDDVRNAMNAFPEPFLVVLDCLYEYHESRGEYEVADKMLETAALIRDNMVE